MQRSQHLDSVAQAEGKAAVIAAGDGAHPAVEVGQPLIEKYVVGASWCTSHSEGIRSTPVGTLTNIESVIVGGVIDV